jgi:mitotic spindle assembly checkpoint protein MAD2B
VFEINSYLKSLDVPTDLLLESESIYALADLEQHLRACLIKINACPPPPTSPSKTNTPNYDDHSPETPPPKDITFSLSIEKTQDGYPEKPPVTKKDTNKNEMVDWMPAEITYNWSNITPLKSVPMDLFRVSYNVILFFFKQRF